MKNLGHPCERRHGLTAPLRRGALTASDGSTARQEPGSRPGMPGAAFSPLCLMLRRTFMMLPHDAQWAGRSQLADWTPQISRYPSPASEASVGRVGRRPGWGSGRKEILSLLREPPPDSPPLRQRAIRPSGSRSAARIARYLRFKRGRTQNRVPLLLAALGEPPSSRFAALAGEGSGES